jgi:hypothetical protein
VVRYPVEEYLTCLGGLSHETVLQEMAHELYAAMAIGRRKSDRIDRCLGWAVASFVAWVAQPLMTITS